MGFSFWYIFFREVKVYLSHKLMCRVILYHMGAKEMHSYVSHFSEFDILVNLYDMKLYSLFFQI